MYTMVYVKININDVPQEICILKVIHTTSSYFYNLSDLVRINFASIIAGKRNRENRLYK